ncbi:hypothetical protein JAAARDRAFT_161763 [Jaapia argillacea MUCL 33604]|uniref:Multifunctional tryptophan biosynthesis protein n=1 Tax=Jaapia argillacea MUCL 33604 TaxID=933084 RepID=A0A067PFE5_9AGAM|nr:hypothetical protein JAAARDRAFT_161763 [Jaapia argillacea MUCL 33604]
MATPTAASAPTAGKGLPTILEKIQAQRLVDIAQSKRTPGTTPTDLTTLLSLNLAPPLIPVLSRMRSSITPGKTPALMAEIKRASPSKGDIALDANAASQALTYALGGASVISVLTEPTWFKGSLLDMRLARQAIDGLPNRPAILRKEFILDEYQIQEARLHGADTILLIVAMLSPARLSALYHFSLSLGMEPLVEVNNATEMSLALSLPAKLIGVNNRNLHDFNVDMGTTTRLADMVKGKDVTLCALSGIMGRGDVEKYLEEGVGAVLVGESLMRAKDTTAFIRELLGLEQGLGRTGLGLCRVKVDGVVTPEQAVKVAEAGAELVGVHLSFGKKNRVSVKQASAISLALRKVRSRFSDTSRPPSATTVSLGNESWFQAQARRLSASLTICSPLLVGIFDGDTTLEEIIRTVHLAQLDIVQLPPSAPLHYSSHIPVYTIRTLQGTSNTLSLSLAQTPGYHHLVLLECEAENSDAAKSVSELDVPLILSIVGETLTADKVQEVVEVVRPWAVCASGNVEIDGGSVDGELVGSFVQAVKAAGEGSPW